MKTKINMVFGILLSLFVLVSCNQRIPNIENTTQPVLKSGPESNDELVSEKPINKIPEWQYYESFGMIIGAYSSCEWLEKNEPEIFKIVDSEEIEFEVKQEIQKPCLNIKPMSIFMYVPCEESLHQAILEAYGIKDNQRRLETIKMCIEKRQP